MKCLRLLLAAGVFAGPALAADLDLHLPADAGRVIAGPAHAVAGPDLVPRCREAWSADLLRCRPPVLVDPTSPAAREQLQTLERRGKPYPELFSWSR